MHLHSMWNWNKTTINATQPIHCHRNDYVKRSVGTLRQLRELPQQSERKKNWNTHQDNEVHCSTVACAVTPTLCATIDAMPHRFIAQQMRKRQSTVICNETFLFPFANERIGGESLNLGATPPMLEFTPVLTAKSSPTKPWPGGAIRHTRGAQRKRQWSNFVHMCERAHTHALLCCYATHTLELGSPFRPS